MLKINLDKSQVTVIGGKKARNKLSLELERKPLVLEGKPMKNISDICYLGDTISGSLGDSVKVTVNKRIGVASHSIFEINIFNNHVPIQHKISLILYSWCLEGNLIVSKPAQSLVA